MIIVEPPETPPALVEQIAQPITACGLNPDRIKIVFSAEHQRIEIYIPAPSDADQETVTCLIRAGRPSRYIFEEEELQLYYDQSLQQLHDRVRTAASDELKKEGKFESLPQRENFANDTDFAQSLERLCGFAPGSALQVGGGSTIFYPPDRSKALTDQERSAYTCMSAAFALISLEKEEDTWKDFDIEAAFPKNEND